MARGTKVSFDFGVERGEDEITVTVEGVYYKGSPATYLDPEDFGEFDITSVKDASGKKVELTDDEEQDAVERGFEVANEEQGDW